MGKPAVDAEPTAKSPADLRSLDMLPDFYNLSRYREALFAVVELLDSGRAEEATDLTAEELQMVGWMEVQQRELGMERDKLEGKLREAAEAARDPKRNMLFQESGRHWSGFILDGETEEEVRRTKRQFQGPTGGGPIAPGLL